MRGKLSGWEGPLEIWGERKITQVAVIVCRSLEQITIWNGVSGLKWPIALWSLIRWCKTCEQQMRKINLSNRITQPLILRVYRKFLKTRILPHSSTLEWNVTSHSFSFWIFEDVSKYQSSVHATLQLIKTATEIFFGTWLRCIVIVSKNFEVTLYTLNTSVNINVNEPKTLF